MERKLAWTWIKTRKISCLDGLRVYKATSAHSGYTVTFIYPVLFFLWSVFLSIVLSELHARALAKKLQRRLGTESL